MPTVTEIPGATAMPLKACATPASQVSTAPPTPFNTWSLPPELHQDESDFPFKRLHSEGSSTFAPEEPAKECTTSTNEAETDDDSFSDAAEEIDPQAVRAFGMPPLQSDLGKWAQRQVEAEEWLEERLSTKFVVDNSELKALTVGVAYRLSKKVNHCDRSIDGPYWGTTILGVDHGDGWVKVGRRYLPTHLDGKRILFSISSLDEVIPACSVDLDGVVHEFASPGQPVDTTNQLKRFHRRRLFRRPKACRDEPVLCPDESGKASIYLYLNGNVARQERMRCKRVEHRRLEVEEGAVSRFGIFSVDAEGIVQDWL